MDKKEFILTNSFGYHFNFISTNMKRYFDMQLKQLDVTVLQFGVLINLYRNNITTQKELIKYISGDEASITRLINRLEAKNLLLRVADKNDKRKKQLQLTSEGIELIEKLIPMAEAANKELVQELSEKEQKELLRLLQKVNITLDGWLDTI